MQFEPSLFCVENSVITTLLFIYMTEGLLVASGSRLLAIALKFTSIIQLAQKLTQEKLIQFHCKVPQFLSFNSNF